MKKFYHDIVRRLMDDLTEHCQPVAVISQETNLPVCLSVCVRRSHGQRDLRIYCARGSLSGYKDLLPIRHLTLCFTVQFPILMRSHRINRPSILVATVRKSLNRDFKT